MSSPRGPLSPIEIAAEALAIAERAERLGEPMALAAERHTTKRERAAWQAGGAAEAARLSALRHRALFIALWLDRLKVPGEVEIPARDEHLLARCRF